MVKKEKRFELKEEQQMGLNGAVRIVVDNVTGVNYLVLSLGGITPLLDDNGNVVIDK